MSEQRVLLIWRDGKERQAVYKTLCGTGAPVDCTVGAPRVEDLGRYRLVVVDLDTDSTVAYQVLGDASRMPKPPAVLVVTAGGDRAALADLMGYEALTNLVAQNKAAPTDLAVTAQKLLSNDIFALEKYLAWGTRTYDHTIRSSDDKTSLLDEFERFLSDLGINRRLAGLARGVADEFISNAVYNAPVDANGRPKYASRPRTERVDLSPDEAARFRYACDGRMLAFSVLDHFGRLQRSTIRSYLQKGFRKGEDQVDQKQGGAGLGLFYVFESLNQLVINIAPNRRTEMIGLMDVSGTFKDFAEKPRSLNIFTEEVRR